MAQLLEQEIRKAHKAIDLLQKQAGDIIKAAENLREFVMHVEEWLKAEDIPKQQHTINSYK